MSTQRALPHTPLYFEDLFVQDDDPWRFRSRWYEVRKRAVTLACLPKPRYGSAFEPGCANGELTAELARRCDRVLGLDGSERAVTLARARNAASAHVDIRRGWLPDDWPQARFDLIVVSEIGYFLAADALTTLTARMRSSLLPGGTVLACHWRRGSDDCVLSGDEVHRRLDGGLRLPLACTVVEADFRIDVWCEDTRSVAQVEGFA